MKLYYIQKKDIPKSISFNDLTTIFRLQILYMIQQAGSGHIGSALSSIDLMTYLFFRVMKKGDIFFSSKGHDVAALYAILIAKGIIPEKEIHNFRRLGGLSGHPELPTPGIVTNTGSLGMGLSKAKGMAIANRLNGKKGRIFVLCGDAEMQEGQIWESIRNVADRKLYEIVLLVDRNYYGCDTNCEEPNLLIKLSNFGLTVRFAFNLQELKSFKDTPGKNDQAKAYILRTQKGQGISFMENFDGEYYPYHGGALEYQDYLKAVKELHDRIPTVKLTGVNKIPKPKVEKANELIKDYGEILVELAKGNKKIVVLDADLVTDCGLVGFKEQFPDRFIECGISEQDMVSTAGGLALQGKIPIVHSFASFLCRRANEQIYNNATEGTKIIYIGAMAGIIPPGPGPSHMCIDDIRIMKTIPGLNILNPKNKDEIREALKWALYHNGKSSYIRLPCMPVMDKMLRC